MLSLTWFAFLAVFGTGLLVGAFVVVIVAAVCFGRVDSPADPDEFSELDGREAYDGTAYDLRYLENERAARAKGQL